MNTKCIFPVLYPTNKVHKDFIKSLLIIIFFSNGVEFLIFQMLAKRKIKHSWKKKKKKIWRRVDFL